MTTTELQGRYTLLDELGRGASAVVYRAHDKRLGTEVAVKVLAPHLTRDADAVQRFRREVLAARQLASPAVAQVYDLVEDEGTLSVVMEYGRSGTLKDHILVVGPLTMPLLDRLMEDLATALRVCHDHGILHRDLKPSNVLFDPATGAMKLIDFGVARIADAGDLDVQGSIVGTPEYMAPEQFDDPVPDPRSDLYAAGVLLYEAATGRAPVSGSTLPEIVRGHREGVRIPPRERNPALGAGAQAVILKLLEPDPAQRFQTAREFLAAVQGRGEDGSTTGTPEPTGGCPTCGSRRESGLPFCPRCGTDLVAIDRFGRWSVMVTEPPDEDQLQRCLASCLPADALRRQGPELRPIPRTVVAFASEQLARWLAKELRRHGIAATTRHLGLPRALIMGLAAGGLVLAIAALVVGLTGKVLDDLAAVMRSSSDSVVLAMTEQADLFWAFALALSGGALAAVSLGIVRHLRESFCTSMAYIDPLRAATTVTGAVRSARIHQNSLKHPRLKAMGAGLIVAAHRLLEARTAATPDLVGPRVEDLLATAMKTLQILDLEYDALDAGSAPDRLRRQDRILHGTELLLRLTTLWRFKRAAALREASARLGGGVGALAGAVDRFTPEHEEATALLRGLEALRAQGAGG